MGASSACRRVEGVEDGAQPDAVAANLVQRILLVTDGTVTNILEAYAGERIRVVKVRQSIERSAADDPDLEIEAGEDVMHREVLLQGRDTRRTLVHAVSHIVPNRLSPAVRTGLLESDKPIGLLLEENRTETYRQILWRRRERAGEYGRAFGIDPADTMVARSYRILAGGWPIMLITERFPLDSFPLRAEGTGGPLAGAPLRGESR